MGEQTEVCHPGGVNLEWSLKWCISPGVVRRWNWALHAKGTYSGTGSKGVGRLEKCGGEGRSPKTNDCRQVSATSLGLEVPRGPRILNHVMPRTWLQS